MCRFYKFYFIFKQQSTCIFHPSLSFSFSFSLSLSFTCTCSLEFWVCIFNYIWQIFQHACAKCTSLYIQIRCCIPEKLIRTYIHKNNVKINENAPCSFNQYNCFVDLPFIQWSFVTLCIVDGPYTVESSKNENHPI